MLYIYIIGITGNILALCLDQRWIRGHPVGMYSDLWISEKQLCEQLPLFVALVLLRGVFYSSKPPGFIDLDFLCVLLILLFTAVSLDPPFLLCTSEMKIVCT